MIKQIKSETTYPFLKWVGGKRWLANTYSTLFPSEFNNYFEPFMGSAAVFFSINPKKAYLADINKELTDCFIGVRDDWLKVEALLKEHHNNHTSDYYYKIRASKYVGIVERAARFIYLNRTCWNGLYRVNTSGQFNVPIGTKTNVMLSTDNFESVSNLLKGAEILNVDFESLIDKATKDDFIFADPPYTVKHNFNGFVKYNEKMFHWDDQVRLSESLINASNRGCLVCLTNAYHPSIISLYENHFDLTPLQRNSVIAASSSNRGMYEELVIRNY